MDLAGTPQIAAVSLVKRFQAYSAWRANVASRIGAYRRWLQENELADAQTELRIGSLLERLGEDKLTIAFVAEFSRGKSELINAIFFADYGRRLLPSSTGRTTMCPTELQWDAALSPCIQLLPIETRATHATTSEFKRFPDEWHVIPLDVGDAQALVEAFQQVRETKRVPIEEAKHYGLFVNHDSSQAAGFAADGMVEIPCWRHAVINFPHPLLEQGLVILDTPGLNAIGTEPELTLNLLPNAHAVLFILAVDTGVSKTDADVWNDYIATVPGRQQGPLRGREQDRHPLGRPAERRGHRRRGQLADGVGRRRAARAGRAGARGVGAEGAGGEDHRRRDAARAEPPARARARALHAAHPGQAVDRPRDHAARDRRPPRQHALDPRGAARGRARAARSSCAACAARTSTWSRR